MDRARVPLAVAALLLAAAAAGIAGSAVAQVEDCGPVAVEPDAYERTVASGGSTTILLDVTNEGAVGGTGWVNVSGATGWVTTVTPGSFPLNATETRQVEVEATPTDEADGGSSPFELRVRAELDCSVSGVASAGSSSAEESIDLQLEGSDSGTQGADGSSLMTGPGMGYVLVGGLAVISVLGYPVIRRRARTSARLQAPQPTRSTAPDQGVSFGVQVTNAGGRPGTIHLDLEDVPAGWSGFLAQASVDLDGGEEATVDVLLRAVDEDAPDRAEVRVRARPEGREKGGDAVELAAVLTRTGA